MHEILISEEEAHHCTTRGDYYAILPMLPELQAEKPEKSALDAEYSSASSVIGREKTAALLRRHQLMPDQNPGRREGEVLR
jgi:hypothetical protein